MPPDPAGRCHWMTSLILTAADEIQNIIGMSVVGPDFEKLKRYNIEELRQGPSEQPTDPEVPPATTEST
jgi:tRNA acetyltransferase TAN1